MDNTVRQAGGFIIQVMPDAEDSVIDRLEESVNSIRSVTDMLESGMKPEDILRYIIKEDSVEILEKIPVKYCCNCSKDRFYRAIASLGQKDLQEIARDGSPVEVNCQFCGSHYVFGMEEINGLIR